MITGKVRINKTAIAIISVAVPLVVAALLLMPVKLRAGQWVYYLPHVNAIINSITALVLVAGFIFIRQKNVQRHQLAMTSAFALGGLFLISYVIYHSTVPSTSYGHEGTIRYVYYFFLISHILLSIVVVPLVLMAIYYAFTQRFYQHRRIVRFTFPVWLYVSVSGVIVYLMISPFYVR
jgi:putative membrane protein